MEMNSKYGLPPLPFSPGVFSRHLDNSKNPFSDYLKNQLENDGGIDSGQNDIRSNRFADDIADIKEKGLSAYVRNIEKEKLEEIREEILERMGLTEETLGKLSSEQRAMIEEIIAREIQSRIAASSVEKTDATGNKVKKTDQILPGIRPDFAFLPMMEEQGKNDPLAATKKEHNG